MIQRIKTRFPETFVIAGNVGTPEAVRELENAGADATKVGIGTGKVCITKIKTGFGTGGWQLAALGWCAKAARKPIIADGGIRTHGDIAKSIRFGATMVMIGSLFAGHEESSGETKIENGIAYKEYFGSASEFQKGEKKNVEGKKIWIQHKGSLKDTLIEMHQDLQSSISYAGGRDLEAILKSGLCDCEKFNFQWGHNLKRLIKRKQKTEKRVFNLFFKPFALTWGEFCYDLASIISILRVFVLLFNTPLFIFAFLPVGFLGYFILQAYAKNPLFPKLWLVLASLFFYAFWNVKYLPLLVGSIIFNYFVALKITQPNAYKRLWLILGTDR